MNELFQQNKVLFLAVVTIVIAAFLVKVIIGYIKQKGLEGIRYDVYKLFLEAEHTFIASGQGEQKLNYVIHLARSMLPPVAQLFITDEVLRAAIQLWFDGIKDLLDDGKINDSIKKEGE